MSCAFVLASQVFSMVLFSRLFFCTTAIRSADFPDSTDSAKSGGFYLTQADLPDLPDLTFSDLPDLTSDLTQLT